MSHQVVGDESTSPEQVQHRPNGKEDNYQPRRRQAHIRILCQWTQADLVVCGGGVRHGESV